MYLFLREICESSQQSTDRVFIDVRKEERSHVFETVAIACFARDIALQSSRLWVTLQMHL